MNESDYNKRISILEIDFKQSTLFFQVFLVTLEKDSSNKIGLAIHRIESSRSYE